MSALKRALHERLIPEAAWSPDDRPAWSDFDLNPDLPRTAEVLTPAAVLVAVMDRPAGPTVVLTRRADTLARHTGQIALPGGRLEPGERAADAALREAWEEVGLPPASVELLGLGDTYESGTGFVITPAVGWVAAPPPLVASPDEVADVFEAPWSFLMDVANHRRDFLEPTTGGPRRWFWTMTWEERRIWGVTAGVLRSLSRRLGHGDAEDAA
ncbi:MAG: CoA pyrophosphatase [Brevundimonas sp.]|nr:MAG: CoA pyrophosphatase [Brevundimonas sp.]